VRTAILSDLHLGVASGEDVLREPAVRALLLEELAGADRVVLLGDVVELRDLALGVALDSARPFFEELGEALGGAGEVTIVPGNHDHRFAEPLLDRLSLAGATELGLEQHDDPGPSGAGAAIAGWLGPARLRIGYPGIWLREDVYATHGHYMDAHLTLPRPECLATAALIRLRGPLPTAATPADYERVLRPIYGFSFGVAQARASVPNPRRPPGVVAWRALGGSRRDEGAVRQLRGSALRAAFPAGIWALNRLLHSEFEADISAAAIFAAGVGAATEMASRLGVDGAHVITGHSHRAGPNDDEAAWELAGGGTLHNTGSWVFASAFHTPGEPPNAYWPGTVTWLEDGAPPRRVQLLRERSHAELTELIRRQATRR
jgi:UDP-2,3-diacylglucosamine pyrophosphatase LpxH